MEIVEKIRNLCKNNNTNISTIEKELGFANGSIRLWDKSSPAIDKVLLVAKKFNVTLEYLITGEQPKTIKGLDRDEDKLIKIYRYVDEYGRTSIMRTAGDQLDRVKKQAEEKPRPKNENKNVQEKH